MRVAINGFGRIGRAVFKICLDNNIDVLAINDLHGVEDAAYLLKHDSVYGIYDLMIILESDNLQQVKSEIDEKLPLIDGIENMTTLISVS